MNEDVERLIRGFFAAYRLIKKLQKRRKVAKPEAFDTINPAPDDFDGSNYWIPRPPLYRWVRRAS